MNLPGTAIAVRPRAWMPRSATRPRIEARRLALPVLLALVLLVALGVRVRNLDLTSGNMDSDESRLTLVARGILEHGWPVLPTGKVYTRGIVQAYLTAPSLAIFRPIDFGARLPSALAGTVLALVVYRYGRSLAGPPAGLIAAALVATSGLLVAWSREAWLYSIFVLLWTSALYLFDRALTRASGRSLLAGGVLAGLGMLAHELGVLLLPAAGLTLLLWLRDGRVRRERTRAALGCAAVLLAALLLQLSFTLQLRADTLAGQFGEIRGFLEPRYDVAGLEQFVFEPFVEDRRWVLITAATLGLLLARGALRPRLWLLLGAGLPHLVLVAFFLSERYPRYGLVLLPPVYLAAACGLTLFAQRLRRRWPRQALVALALVGLAFASALVDPGNLERRTRAVERETTWLGELYLQGYRSGDLILADLPIQPRVYLGRTDGWLRSREYEKYTIVDADGELRDIHSGAYLIRSVDEFERLIREPNRGKRAWVIGSNQETQWYSWLDSDVRKHIQELATIRKMADDNRRIYLVPL